MLYFTTKYLMHQNNYLHHHMNCDNRSVLRNNFDNFLLLIEVRRIIHFDQIYQSNMFDLHLRSPQMQFYKLYFLHHIHNIHQEYSQTQDILYFLYHHIIFLRKREIFLEKRKNLENQGFKYNIGGA